MQKGPGIQGATQQPAPLPTESSDIEKTSNVTSSETSTQKHLPASPSSPKDPKQMHQMEVMETSPTSNVNPEAAKIENLEKQYISHCVRKATLEEKKEVIQNLKTIRELMKSPENTGKDCGFVITFVSKSGKEVSVLPPDEKLDPERLNKLLEKLETQLDEVEESFVKNDHDQKLDETIEIEHEQIDDTYNELKQLAPQSTILNYKPRKARQYALNADLASWPPVDNTAKEGFVIKLASETKTHESNKKEPSPQRVILSESAETTVVDPIFSTGPLGLEFPAEIKPLPEDADLFLPKDYAEAKTQDERREKIAAMSEALATNLKPSENKASQNPMVTVINGNPDLTLPVDKHDFFRSLDNQAFKRLHENLQSQFPRVGQFGMARSELIQEMGPSPIRQCFCYRGMAGTAYVHIFADAFDQKPYGNSDNQFMLLWYPDNSETLEPAAMAKTAGYEIVRALHEYHAHANAYNNNPSTMRPSLNARLEQWEQSKPTKSAKPKALPTAKTLRLCSLPHETESLSSPPVVLDNATMDGVCQALTEIQGNHNSDYFTKRSIERLEIPGRVSPKKESEETIPKTTEYTDLINPTDTRDMETGNLDMERITVPQPVQKVSFNFTEETAQHILKANMENAQKQGELQQITSIGNTDQTKSLQSIKSSNAAFGFTDIKDLGHIGEIYFHLEGADSKHWKEPDLEEVAQHFESVIKLKLLANEPLNDSNVMAVIYRAFTDYFGAHPSELDVNICLNLDDEIWVINRGNTHTLCCPRDNPIPRYISANNTAPEVAGHLKDALPPSSTIKSEDLPAITKLPKEETDQIYLIQSGKGLRQLIPDTTIFEIIKTHVEDKGESEEEITEEINNIKGEISKRITENLEDNEGVTITPPTLILNFHSA